MDTLFQQSAFYFKTEHLTKGGIVYGAADLMKITATFESHFAYFILRGIPYSVDAFTLLLYHRS